MIITKLMGGLGNQLFQYSLGRHLSEKHGVPLKVDLDFLLRGWKLEKDTTQYQYELPHFNIVATPATAAEVAPLKLAPARGWRRQARKLSKALTPPERWPHYVERGYAFDPRILRAGPNVYLEGYWQSPYYFEPIADILRRELTLREAPDAQNAAVLDEIRRTTAVAVHVRRADYVNNPSASKVHGACGLDYYAAALALIAQRVASPHYFLFSDDPAWVRANLKVPGPATYVGHNGPRPHEDIRLMSHCQHFVIANSTFSWWGAWLANAPGKTVVAPKVWALNPDLCVDTRLPKEWITV